MFNDSATITFTGCNSGGTDGIVNKDSIAQNVANITGKNVFAYLNNTSQIKDGDRYYQKPVRMKWGQTVVEGFTQFSPENPPGKSESTKKFVWWNPFTWFNW